MRLLILQLISAFFLPTLCLVAQELEDPHTHREKFDAAIHSMEWVFQLESFYVSNYGTATTSEMKLADMKRRHLATHPNATDEEMEKMFPAVNLNRTEIGFDKIRSCYKGEGDDKWAWIWDGEFNNYISYEKDNLYATFGVDRSSIRTRRSVNTGEIHQHLFVPLNFGQTELDQKEAEDRYKKFEKPRLADKVEYHSDVMFDGVKCHLFAPRAFDYLTYRYYVGVESGRLRGYRVCHWIGNRRWDRKELADELRKHDVNVEPHQLVYEELYDEDPPELDDVMQKARESVLERRWKRLDKLEWDREVVLADWREVKAGCFYPYEQRTIFRQTTTEPGNLSLRESVRTISSVEELLIDEELPDELFELEVPDQARVEDRRGEVPFTYVFDINLSPQEMSRVIREARAKAIAARKKAK